MKLLVGGFVLGVLVGGFWMYAGGTEYFDSAPDALAKESIEASLLNANGSKGARVAKCRRVEGPFYRCRVLSHPDEGAEFEVTVARNGRCYTGTRAAATITEDRQLPETVWGWLSRRSDCEGVELPEAKRDASSADPYAGDLTPSPNSVPESFFDDEPTPEPTPVPDSFWKEEEFWEDQQGVEQGNAAGSCDPSYSGACVPDDGNDYDCPEIDGSGFRSDGRDPHGLDRDNDGIACD